MNISSINIFKKGVSKSLGSLEALVMEVLWKSTDAQSARHVTDSLTAEHAVSFNAVSTVLNRLQKKKLVRKIASGKRYAFEPTVSKKEYCYSIVTSGLSSLLGDTSLLSAAGISGGQGNTAIDPDTLSLLESFINSHEQS